MKRNYLLIITLLSTVFSLFAQEKDSQLDVNLQLRTRAELRDGALVPKVAEQEPAAFINNRTRLNISYLKDFYEVALSLQHTGVWGDDKQVHKNADIGVHEAWAKINIEKIFFVKIGRQELSYDDQRILGALDWHVAGRHHDALKLGYEKGKNKLHFILAYNQHKEHVHGNLYDSKLGQPYKTMQTVWYNFAVSPKTKFSLLAMNLGKQNTDGDQKVEYMQTLGTHINWGITPKSNATFSGYYQMGNTVAKQSVSAFMFSGIFDYQITDKMKAKVGMDYLSGNDTETQDYEAFNPLYGTHHKFYGAMDYFYVSPFVSGYNPGLWDTYVGLSQTINPKLSLGLTYHYFQMTTDVPKSVETEEDYLNKGLGSEVDFNMKWKFHKDITLTGGFSFALPTKSMEIVKGGDANKFQSWTWLSLNVSPNIFRR